MSEHDLNTQKMKMTAAFMLGFFGFSMILIGLLFGFLFEVYGLFALAGVGVVMIVIAIFLGRSTEDMNIFNWAEMSSWETNEKCGKCGKYLKFKGVNVCPFCGEPTRKRVQTKTNVIIKDGAIHCASCNAQVQNNLKFCPYCGVQL